MVVVVVIIVAAAFIKHKVDIGGGREGGREAGLQEGGQGVREEERDGGKQGGREERRMVLISQHPLRDLDMVAEDRKPDLTTVACIMLTRWPLLRSGLNQVNTAHDA